MSIKILGPGCANCQLLHKLTLEALEELNQNIEVEYIKDMDKIQEYNIFTTPGLVFENVLVHQGKPIPGKEKIKLMIKQFYS